MTKEEAIKIFRHKIETMEDGAISSDYGTDKDAFALAIEALKQESYETNVINGSYWKGFHNGIRTEKFRESKREPCEDCISREAVLSLQTEYAEEIGATTFWKLRDDIRKLSPVTPKQKTGHWVTWKEAGNDIPSETRFECSECHEAAQTLCNGLDLLSPFCPNCGAKMESEGV